MGCYGIMYISKQIISVYKGWALMDDEPWWKEKTLIPCGGGVGIQPPAEAEPTWKGQQKGITSR
jgi:hypothetical protein